MMKIGKYTIKALDEFNFGLYETRKKGVFKGKKTEGNKEHLIGYFGYLSMAMGKIISLEVLNALGDTITTKEIIKVITDTEAKINNAYKNRPSMYLDKEEK